MNLSHKGYKLSLGRLNRNHFLSAAGTAFPFLTRATPTNINPEAMNTVIVSDSSKINQPSNSAITGFTYAYVETKERGKFFTE